MEMKGRVCLKLVSICPAKFNGIKDENLNLSVPAVIVSQNTFRSTYILINDAAVNAAGNWH